MIGAFTFAGHGGRAVFGVGSIAQIAEEVQMLGARRVLILTSPSHRDVAGRVAADLGELFAGVCHDAAMHVPVETAMETRQLAIRLQADCCVTIGGGSAIGLGKAVALALRVPIVAVPTSYAGSEMTSIYGITEDGKKVTGRDPHVRPKSVVYDPALTLSLPPSLSAASGMNAIAHCVEALYAMDGNPIVSLMAEEGISALALSLPRIIEDPSDVDARSEALYGAWLAGHALEATTMGLHHKICHVLGGAFGLPHAELHAIVLPHVARYNSKAAPQGMARFARALKAGDAPSALYHMLGRLRLPSALKQIGMPRSGVQQAAEEVCATPYRNPKVVEYESVKAMLERAYEGVEPRP